ncbi:redoxin domain-containing protein [Halobacterium zhouii]|uniref:redoxin domain-containing protein n=1 Tax=Halobacterium zhouii TaxID=2902624 RepID=UPI001E4348C7|nr:redoxin domain-containing protein [Halobacterium zhouii]
MTAELEVGDTAPELEATLVQPDGTAGDVSLADLWADRPLVLAFYTNDFSPDCVKEWCSFRDYGWFTSDDRVQVVGASSSRVATHRKFIDYLDLEFPLYADTDLALADAFGVTYRAFKLFERARRSVFLVDTDGTIRYRWLGESLVDPTRDQPPLGDVRSKIEGLVGDKRETFGFN